MTSESSSSMLLLTVRTVLDSLSRKRQIEIEQEVVGLLQDFGIKEFPISITRIASALDIQLVPYSTLSENEMKLAFAASDDAFHVRTSDFTNVRIVFDDTKGAYYYRARFSGGCSYGFVNTPRLLPSPLEGMLAPGPRKGARKGSALLRRAI
ncbi:MAG: hypothetical protein ACOX69_09505, partial [Coriobacteriales bacterium]